MSFVHVNLWRRLLRPRKQVILIESKSEPMVKIFNGHEDIKDLQR